MIGKTLGHYQVVEQLGAGGMGVVYRAHDTRLERDVALKVLPPGTLADESARKRFRKEALALSRLNHPNIATIHDFDTEGETDFIVMELIPGTRLDEKCGEQSNSQDELIRVGIQLAQGLGAAHAAGVLHRDLKPSNLVCTPDGRLKILDFGLARLHEAPSTGARTETASHLDHAAGTLPYMAPEQLRGEHLDERTDIYGAGAVLYELATGRRPFFGSTAASLTDAILHQEPPPPSSFSGQISPDLEKIILKALDKHPARRYQSASDLGADLQRARGGQVPLPRAAAGARRNRVATIAAALILGIAAVGLNVGGARDQVLEILAPREAEPIAVLPLSNLSQDPKQDYFVDGMTRELITQLGRIASLRVTASFSSMQYKKSNKPVPEIARELKVKKILSGSVRRSGERGRVALELVEFPSGRQVWSHSYDCDLGDALTAQAQIAQAVAREIDVRVTRKDKARLAALQPVNPAAHDEYLKGVAERQPEKAKEHFERAIALDPNFATGLTALADWYIARGWFGQNYAPIETYPKVKELALKAMALDPGDATPHVQLATVKLHHEWDWDGAEREAKRAIELNPSHAGAHHLYAHHLMALDRLEDSVMESRKASQLDPLNPTLSTCVGWHCLYARQYEEAITQCLKLVKQEKAVPLTYYYLGRVYVQTGKLEQGIAALQTSVEKSGGATRMLSTLGYAYGRAGRRAEAEQVLAEMTERAKTKYISAMDFAVVYAGLGDKQQTFEWLEKGYLERSTWLVHLKWDDRFSGVRTDPRFAVLLQRIGLPKPDVLAGQRTPQSVALPLVGPALF